VNKFLISLSISASSSKQLSIVFPRYLKWVTKWRLFPANLNSRNDLHTIFRREVGLKTIQTVFTARCTLVQSAVLRSHVVCLSVCPSVCSGVARNFSQRVRNSNCLQCSTYELHCFCRERNFDRRTRHHLPHFLNGNVTEVAEIHTSWRTFDGGGTLLVAAGAPSIYSTKNGAIRRWNNFDQSLHLLAVLTLFRSVPDMQTDKRTGGIVYQYRPLQKLLLALNCRDCRVSKST